MGVACRSATSTADSARVHSFFRSLSFFCLALILSSPCCCPSAVCSHLPCVCTYLLCAFFLVVWKQFGNMIKSGTYYFILAISKGLIVWLAAWLIVWLAARLWMTASRPGLPRKSTPRLWLTASRVAKKKYCTPPPALADGQSLTRRSTPRFAYCATRNLGGVLRIGSGSSHSAGPRRSSCPWWKSTTNARHKMGTGIATASSSTPRC